jgi:hypothetical protein
MSSTCTTLNHQRWRHFLAEAEEQWHLNATLLASAVNTTALTELLHEELGFSRKRAEIEVENLMQEFLRRVTRAA